LFPSDVAARGSRFNLGGSPTLAHLLREAAREIPHPTDSNRTLLDATTDHGTLTGPIPKPIDGAATQLGKDLLDDEITRQEFANPENTHIKPLGSGSGERFLARTILS